MEPLLRLVGKEEAANITGWSARTLVRKRQTVLLEGVHFIRQGQGKTHRVVYNEPLLRHFTLCGYNPRHPDHLRECEKFLKSLKRSKPSC